MANALFNALGNSVLGGYISNIIAQVQQFQKTFTGDARAEVAKLNLTQEQMNTLVPIANQIMAMMPK